MFNLFKKKEIMSKTKIKESVAISDKEKVQELEFSIDKAKKKLHELSKNDSPDINVRQMTHNQEVGIKVIIIRLEGELEVLKKNMK